MEVLAVKAAHKWEEVKTNCCERARVYAQEQKTSEGKESLETENSVYLKLSSFWSNHEYFKKHPAEEKYISV